MFRMKVKTGAGTALHNEETPLFDFFAKARELKLMFYGIVYDIKYNGITGGKLSDRNGNEVGEWSLESEDKVDRDAEFQYLLLYAAQSCFADEICRDQLRILWTAYCLHQNLDVDTADYCNDLNGLWQRVAESEPDTADWSSYNDFENFMCNYLV